MLINMKCSKFEASLECPTISYTFYRCDEKGNRTHNGYAVISAEPCAFSIGEVVTVMFKPVLDDIIEVEEVELDNDTDLDTINEGQNEPIEMTDQNVTKE